MAGSLTERAVRPPPEGGAGLDLGRGCTRRRAYAAATMPFPPVIQRLDRRRRPSSPRWSRRHRPGRDLGRARAGHARVDVARDGHAGRSAVAAGTRPSSGVAPALVATVSALAAGPALVAAFNAAVRGRAAASSPSRRLSAGGVVRFPVLYPPGDGYLLNLVIGGLLTAWSSAWGFARALPARAGRPAHARAVEDARAAERRRIAREMHDVLAHRLSLLSLHAGALEYRGDEAAGVIRENARAALEDLRDVIGILRDGDARPPSRRSRRSPTSPTLIEECRAAGCA